MAEYKNLGEDMKCNYTSSLYIYIYICLEKSADRKIFALGRKNPLLGEQQGVLAKMKTLTTPS